MKELSRSVLSVMVATSYMQFFFNWRKIALPYCIVSVVKQCESIIILYIYYIIYMYIYIIYICVCIYIYIHTNIPSLINSLLSPIPPLSVICRKGIEEADVKNGVVDTGGKGGMN